MRSTELAVPAENTVRALRRLAPGARLRTPCTPELRVIAEALRSCAPAELSRVHPGPVGRVVLAAQLRALDRAMTGFFATGVPESARLVRAARFGRVRPGRRLRERLATEPGLRTAALAWAEAVGYRMLAAELRGVRELPEEEDGRLAAELAVAELLPQAELRTSGREVLRPGPAEEGAGPRGVGGVAGAPPGPDAGAGGVGGAPPGPDAGAGGESAGPPLDPGGSPAAGGGRSGSPLDPGGGGSAAGGGRSGSPLGPGGGGESAAGGRSGCRSGLPPAAAGAGSAPPAHSAFLHVRSVRVTEQGFQVDVHADPPAELRRDGGGLTLRALWWNGLGRVVDDLGYEYLLLAKDHAGTGIVRHWCHPRLAPGATVLRLESAGYRGERLRLEPAAAGSCAEVLVKLELTVRLGV
ncbi:MULTISPECIES: hypothetical protein [unclassified Amycolatopsis]|uniref:hypothetical protein n=1 Tax=unclassified Amycolatopsis TaxID=2618356 RepID=UPI0028770EA4|nr:MULTISPECIES: hypothetical protein [unclassified Amycolatopsis]MDS0131982.1 hypothetical protein [Amycolatopsis sp. 505]MDS0141280.1 hypothetical protein [Amycolatopsis sp. CM201R]